jgi:UDP-2,3-diacylglucosamine hydrolase|tara:strand:+ start:810 stop:1589 length:780 start_codon:yes stop_codon:yes gene_type:complete
MHTLTIDLDQNKKIFFASDFHLGAPNKEGSRSREKKIIRWLETVEKEAAAILLVGDLFDFWFEYDHVVPKGFVRFLNKLAEFSDKGIPIYIFHGNHDMWMFDYLESEIGATVFSDPIHLKVNDKVLFVGHGDGLGPGDYTFKALRKVFRNKIAQWLFKWIHPDIGVGLANKWSSRSRINHTIEIQEINRENEWLFLYSKKLEADQHFDYYVFGHRHLPLTLDINKESTYINLGEWLNFNSFGVFDGTDFQIDYFESDSN